MPPTARPTNPPTLRPTNRQITPSSGSTSSSCFTTSTYDAIDEDIATLRDGISNPQRRAHILGGIVRLVAHDFMDYDRRDASDPMGPDGCFEATHPANAGLPEDIWCADCELTRLYRRKYSHLGRADFWVAAGNAVIRQTSIDNGLDLRDTFRWGRRDAAICRGSGDRLPTPDGCDQVMHFEFVRPPFFDNLFTPFSSFDFLSRSDAYPV